MSQWMVSRTMLGATLALVLLAPPALAGKTELKVRQVAGAIEVEVTRPQPTREHALGSGAARLQASGWTLVQDGEALRLKDGKVTSAEPFSRYRLRVPADTRALDRIYAAHIAVGGCGALLRPSAFTSDERLVVRFEAGDGLLVVAPGGAVSSAGGPALEAGGSRHVFLGQAGCIHREAGAVWLYDASRMPPELLVQLQRALPDGLARLMARLDTPLDVKPVIGVDFAAREDGFSFRGDVDEAGTVLLRLGGRGMDPAHAEQLDAFLLHEMFHLWNGVAFDQPEERSRAWLSEGAAEYGALKLRREQGHLADAAFLQGMEERLNRCVGVLARRPGGIEARDAEGGSLVYDCGTVVQWLGDHLVAGEGDFFSVWRAVFAEAGDEDSRYSAEDYLRRVTGPASSPSSRAALDWLVGGEGEAGVPSLVEGFVAAGIPLMPLDDVARDPEALKAVLMHLLAASCSGGPYGYTTEPDYLVLDTGDRCGALSGDGKVSRINGFRIGEQDRAAYRSAQESCRERGLVSLSHGRQALEAPCRDPLADLPPRLRVSGDRFSPRG